MKIWKRNDSLSTPRMSHACWWSTTWSIICSWTIPREWNAALPTSRCSTDVLELEQLLRRSQRLLCVEALQLNGDIRTEVLLLGTTASLRNRVSCRRILGGGNFDRISRISVVKFSYTRLCGRIEPFCSERRAESRKYFEFSTKTIKLWPGGDLKTRLCLFFCDGANKRAWREVRILLIGIDIPSAAWLSAVTKTLKSRESVFLYNTLATLKHSSESRWLCVTHTPLTPSARVQLPVALSSLTQAIILSWVGERRSN